MCFIRFCTKIMWYNNKMSHNSLTKEICISNKKDSYIFGYYIESVFFFLSRTNSPNYWIVLLQPLMICEAYVWKFYSRWCRDGNSSEIFTPWGIEESRNGNSPFLEDQGRKNLFLGVLEEFRGMECYFILLFFQDLLVFLVLSSDIITKKLTFGIKI